VPRGKVPPPDRRGVHGGLSDTFVGGFLTTISPKMSTWT
jgi:hypothetical protein